MDKPHLELAEVFRKGFFSYAASHPQPHHHYAVANAILRCHTAAMGGHVFRCDGCGSDRITYNSCRNRHCPSCQAQARARWVHERTKELLPVGYFHVVFTIPAQLNPFALRNKEVLYSILFTAASQTIRDLGNDQDRLGAQTGCVAVLHTWGQNLSDHPHLHCILPAGGLDDDRWVHCKDPKFLFPVKVMSKLFRGKFIAAFKEGIDAGEIKLHGVLGEFAQPGRIPRLIDALYKTPWVVYAKAPFGGPAAVVKYLGRYTHRIAIANSRLISISDSHVSFQWKDYADNNKSKTMTVTIDEFLRRFLMHVLPQGFVRIRYYGFLANRSRAANLQFCRDQTAHNPAALALLEAAAQKEELGPAKSPQQTCPACCKGQMLWLMDIPRRRAGDNAAHDATTQPHLTDYGGGRANAA